MCDRCAGCWRPTQLGPGAPSWASERWSEEISEFHLMKYEYQVQLLLEKLPLLHGVPGILRWMYRYIDRLLKNSFIDTALSNYNFREGTDSLNYYKIKAVLKSSLCFVNG